MAAFLLRRLGPDDPHAVYPQPDRILRRARSCPVIPGRAILGTLAAQSAVQALDHQLGVDRPLLTRYLSWVGGLLHGNFGHVVLLPDARSSRSSGPR